MNRIPKCRTKYCIPQPNNIKPSKKETTKENLAQKLSKKTLKFSANRQFGKDITNNIKSSIHSIYNNHSTKVVTVMEKNSDSNNNNIYIKKHSSTSQVAQKNPKIKISLGERKLRENKSGSMINKRSDITVSENYYNKNNNNTKKEYPPSNSIQGGSRLHSSISFGMNVNNMRPIPSSNSISVRISNNPKNYKIYGNKNNRSINTHSNNIFYGNNTNINNNSILSNNTNNTNQTNHTNIINNKKSELTTAYSNLDLM